jgi:catechol 2,3-dioxygenase-like lactoylglutathione lyase family enzyme
MRIEKISAVTLTVASMRDSVRFYGNVLGTRVAFRGAFGPQEGIVLEETDDSVVLAHGTREADYLLRKNEFVGWR